MQRPVQATRHQWLLVHPGHGGGDFARALGRLKPASGQQPVATRDIQFAVQDHACTVPGKNRLGLACVVQHLGDDGGFAAGQDGDFLAGLQRTAGNAAPENAAALGGVGAGGEPFRRQAALRRNSPLGGQRGHASAERGGRFLNPLHRQGEGLCGVCRIRRQVFQDLQQAGAVVIAPAGVGINHVVADQCGHRDYGLDGDARMFCKLAQRGADVGKGQRRVVHGVKLVDGKHNGRHTQQVHQQRMAARLRQQLGQC
ncbi:hypothetical protein D9M73_71100 [compost metagenome]